MRDGRHSSTSHGLTPERVEAYLRYRLEILSFIEQRFRQGIQISQQQIETYYHDTLLPQYAPGETIPPLDQVAPRIQEILLEQQVNVLFDNWLNNLRQQGDVEVLDPELAPKPPPLLRRRGDPRSRERRRKRKPMSERETPPISGELPLPPTPPRPAQPSAPLLSAPSAAGVGLRGRFAGAFGRWPLFCRQLRRIRERGSQAPDRVHRRPHRRPG